MFVFINIVSMSILFQINFDRQMYLDHHRDHGKLSVCLHLSIITYTFVYFLNWVEATILWLLRLLWPPNVLKWSFEVFIKNNWLFLFKFTWLCTLNLPQFDGLKKIFIEWSLERTEWSAPFVTLFCFLNVQTFFF